MALAEKIRLAVEENSIEYKGRQVKITVSLGASMREDGQTLEQVIEHADKAMYQAKSAGRNKALLSK